MGAQKVFLSWEKVGGNVSSPWSVVRCGSLRSPHSAKRRAHSVLLPSSHPLCAMLYALCVFLATDHSQLVRGRGFDKYLNWSKLTRRLRLSEHPWHFHSTGELQAAGEFTHLFGRHFLRSLQYIVYCSNNQILQHFYIIGVNHLRFQGN